MRRQGYPVYDITGLATYQSDFLVGPFAPYIVQHHKLHVPHGHTFYHLVYITKGGGYHTIDFDRFEVRPYQLYAMAPGQVHRWNFEGEVDGYVLNFSTHFFQSFLLRSDYIEEFTFFHGQAKQSVLDIPESLRPRIKSVFEEMLPLRTAVSISNIDKLRVLMLKLFLDLADLQAPSQPSPLSYNAVLLRNFKRLVEKHYAELRLPKDYAELLYITPNHLNAICSDLIGQSAGTVIRDRVILEAKRLLINPELSIATIADTLNFKDNSNFTKFFKKYTDTTPETFRRNMG